MSSLPFEIARLVLEYLKVIVSWPVAVTIIGLVFLIRFKLPMAALIDRIASIRIPGGGELLTPQAAMNVLDATRPAAAPEPAPPAVDDDQGNADLQQRVQSERSRATLWEYRFLNYFLVPRTQMVLDWLDKRGPIGIEAYDAWWLPVITNPVERMAIIDALRNHHLIFISPNNVMSVTPKGNEYIEWRGSAERFLAAKLSPPPAPPPVSAPAEAEPGPVAPPADPPAPPA